MQNSRIRSGANYTRHTLIYQFLPISNELPQIIDPTHITSKINCSSRIRPGSIPITRSRAFRSHKLWVYVVADCPIPAYGRIIRDIRMLIVPHVPCYSRSV